MAPRGATAAGDDFPGSRGRCSFPWLRAFGCWRRIGGGGSRGAGALLDGLLEAVAASGDVDDFGAVEDAVEDGGGGGLVAKELAPLVDGTVGSEDGGAHFVAAHDDFQEVFGGLGAEGFHADVVEDEQVGAQVALEGFVAFGGLVAGVGEVAGEVEDGAVEAGVAGFDGFASESLGEVAFADSGRADEEDVAVLADILAGGQRVDLAAGDTGLEAEVEGVEAARFAEAGLLAAAMNGAAVADVEFVLEEEFEELGVGDLMRGGFVKAEFEVFAESLSGKYP